MKRKNAFTLIELLAVIAVIAILTIIAVPNVMKLYKESKKNMFITQVRKTAKSAQLEYAEGTKNTFDCNKDLSGQTYQNLLPMHKANEMRHIRLQFSSHSSCFYKQLSKLHQYKQVQLLQHQQSPYS